MSDNWPRDINDMHARFGVHDAVEKMDKEKLLAFLKFRLDFLQEELDETVSKGFEKNDAEEIVDGLIDLCVVAIGTLDAFGVDAHKAWNEVHSKNMQKEPGVKKERPNPLGLPDLMKPEGFIPPSHSGNHGFLPEILG